MTLDGGVQKGASEIRKSIGKMEDLPLQQILLVPEQACLQARRDYLRSAQGTETVCCEEKKTH